MNRQKDRKTGTQKNRKTERRNDKKSKRDVGRKIETQKAHFVRLDW